MIDLTKDNLGLTLNDFLLHKTKVGDFVDVSDCGYNGVACFIDDEDLFIGNIDGDIKAELITNVELEILKVIHEDGEREDVRCWHVNVEPKYSKEESDFLKGML